MFSAVNLSLNTFTDPLKTSIQIKTMLHIQLQLVSALKGVFPVNRIQDHKFWKFVT